VSTAIIYSALHRRKDADEALARLESQHAQDGALLIADVYAYRGEKDKAFIWLDTAFRQKHGAMWAIKQDQFLKRLEGDPRYKAFLRKMNLPE
jgi:hypothetical protein